MTQITIAGKSFEVSSPYVPGTHDLTEGEAHTLNQTRHENIRNNFAKKVKEAGDGVSLEDLQSQVSAYDEKYEFGVRGTGEGVSRDPVETEARNGARAAIRAALKERGKSADVKAINAAAEQILADPVRGEKYRAAARERVAAKQAAAAEAAAGLAELVDSIGAAA